MNDEVEESLLPEFLPSILNVRIPGGFLSGD